MILNADARAIPLPDESMHCCITSPPYWGLRDYGAEPTVWDGEPGCCQHEWDAEKWQPRDSRRDSLAWATGGNPAAKIKAARQGAFCPKCGAWRGSLGLEPTLELYVAHIVDVLRGVRRVLQDDGTLWLNLGDSYTSGGRSTRDPGQSKPHLAFKDDNFADGLRPGTPPGLKPKDLCGIPWRVAFALQADGWYLRSDIIWSKPNPMPESVQDRPTSSHEHVFLLTKSERYYFDADAIAEPCVTADTRRLYGSQGAWEMDGRPKEQQHGGQQRGREGRNSRIHQDRDPQHPSEREIRKQDAVGRYAGKWSGQDPQSSGRRLLQNMHDARAAGADHDSPFGLTRNARTVWTIPTDAFDGAHFATFPRELVRRCIAAGCPEHGLVLDPFGGSGTVADVAFLMGRQAVVMDLKYDYCRMALGRVPPLAMFG